MSIVFPLKRIEFGQDAQFFTRSLRTVLDVTGPNRPVRFPTLFIVVFTIEEA